MYLIKESRESVHCWVCSDYVVLIKLYSPAVFNCWLHCFSQRMMFMYLKDDHVNKLQCLFLQTKVH